MCHYNTTDGSWLGHNYVNSAYIRDSAERTELRAEKQEFCSEHCHSLDIWLWAKSLWFFRLKFPHQYHEELDLMFSNVSLLILKILWLSRSKDILDKFVSISIVHSKWESENKKLNNSTLG